MAVMIEGDGEEGFRRHVISGTLHALLISVVHTDNCSTVQAIETLIECLNKLRAHLEREGHK